LGYPTHSLAAAAAPAAVGVAAAAALVSAASAAADNKDVGHELLIYLPAMLLHPLSAYVYTCQ